MTQLIRQKFEEEIQAGIKALKKYHPQKIILYGSVANGDFREDSDIDFLVIKNGVEKIKPHLRVYQVLQFFSRPNKIEPRVYSPEEIKNVPANNFFLKEALASGKVIYEKR